MAELALYDVRVRGHVTQMKLSKEDAERLGATRVGEVKPAEPQPVPRPPYATDDSDDPADAEPVPAEKQAPAPRNKARTASTSQK